MSFLHWQQTDKNQFAVFIRDLTKNLNNVKHMVEDSIKEPDKPKYHKKGKKVVQGRISVSNSTRPKTITKMHTHITHLQMEIKKIKKNLILVKDSKG